jgi:hypothetical protein
MDWGMAKKLAHGGKRDGAGRPPANPEGKTITLAASVPEALAADLDAYAEAQGWSRSRAVTEAIRKLLGRRKGR